MRRKSNREEELVRQLLALFQSYSDSEVLAALELIRTGDPFDAFTNLGRELGNIRPRAPTSHRAPRKKSATKPSARDRLNRQIDELRLSGRPPLRDLADVLQAAREGQILKSSSAVLQLLNQLGIEPSRTADRFSLLKLLGETVAGLTPDRQLQVTEAARQSGENTSSLERWTNIIVRRGEREEP
jgi:hypothetical protein